MSFQIAQAHPAQNLRVDLCFQLARTPSAKWWVAPCLLYNINPEIVPGGVGQTCLRLRVKAVKTRFTAEEQRWPTKCAPFGLSQGHYGQGFPKNTIHPAMQKQPSFVCPPFIMENPQLIRVGEIRAPPLTISLEQ